MSSGINYMYRSYLGGHLKCLEQPRNDRVDNCLGDINASSLFRRINPIPPLVQFHHLAAMLE